MFKQLQQVGKAFMLPIAILPAAGLFRNVMYLKRKICETAHSFNLTPCFDEF